MTSSSEKLDRLCFDCFCGPVLAIKKCFWPLLSSTVKVFYRKQWSNLDQYLPTHKSENRDKRTFADIRQWVSLRRRFYGLIGGGICLFVGSTLQFDLFPSKFCFSQKSVLLNSCYSGVAVSFFLLLLFVFGQKKIHDTNIQYITKLNRSVIQGLKRRKL